jgi:hypothetical protein
MSSERESVVLSGAELDQAREIVIKILEVVHSDPERLALFLEGTSFDLAAARELAQSPLFMLSVLDTATKDEKLLAALETDARITKPLMEMTQARLAFHVAAELTRQGESRAQTLDVGERARQKLRELSEEKAGGGPAGKATGKPIAGCGKL